MDPRDCLSELKELVRKTPLSEQERQNQYTNIQALKNVTEEWNRLKEEIGELKKQNKSLHEKVSKKNG